MSDNRKEILIELFQDRNGTVMSDCELLELVLSIVNSRSDCRKTAADILKKFGDFSKAVNAPVKRLLEINGMSENSATALKLIAACGKRVSAENTEEQKNSILSEWDKFTEFCRQNMAYEDVEEFRIFLIDEHFHCFGNKVISRGTVNQTYAYPRDIVQIAEEQKAKYIILAHNHPSGNCKPSDEDNELTSNVFEATEGVGINLFDHLIVTSGDIYSYRANGFFEKNSDK